MLTSRDLSLIDAVARHGRLADAARELKLDHSTVFRRLRALEALLGAALFERRDGRYRATDPGRRLVEVAGRVTLELQAVQRELTSTGSAPVGGTVRITTTTDVANHLLPAWLTAIAHEHPGVRPEVLVSNQLLDLQRGEADVAIRPTRKPPAGCVGRPLGPLRSAVYMRRSRAGNPQRWLAYTASSGPPADARWMAARVPGAAVVARFDDFAALHAAAREGLGAAVLPCFVGDADPALQRVGEPIAALQSRLWLLCAPTMRRIPSVAAVFRTISREAARALGQEARRDA
ncbi:MAG: LysR family transcriptional regulator [Burkholderiales bacterium]|jgi:molybdate transport repressor ModE-like protein|nr:LysR family transcriptional regulator [Burkholderiales bacterium]